MSNLDFCIEDTPLAACVDQLDRELHAAGIALRPLVYLSSEWGRPDRVPIIGVPFFLAHPRLLAIERQFVYEAEGESPEQAMRLLRHEAGHAFLDAHRLYRLASRRRPFGLFSTPDEEPFRAIPSSRRFVRRLPDHDAPKHPDEDFAETFAVWLIPGEPWHDRPTRLDPELLEIFALRTDPRGIEDAASMLRAHRAVFVARICRGTHVRQYQVRAAVDPLVRRAEHLHLGLRPEEASYILLDLTARLTRMVTNEHHTGSDLGRRR